MKTLSFWLLAGIAIMSQGCAQLPMDDVTANANYDVGKVAAVERYAARNHIQVIWVNYPQARAQ